MQQQKKAMIEALEKSLGVVTTACKAVGIDRATHYRWLKVDDDYKHACTNIEDVALDFAESQLYKQIKDGSTAATIFYLKTRGKRRGYIEKSEVEHSGNVTSINYNVKGAEQSPALQNLLKQIEHLDSN